MVQPGFQGGHWPWVGEACSKLPYGAKQDQKPGVLGPEAVSSQQATPWRGEGEVHLPLARTQEGYECH